MALTSVLPISEFSRSLQVRDARFDILNSIRWPERFRMLSAPGTLVEAGVAGSTITFSSVVTAALVACCSRAVDWL
jgi:hypothetical protein